LRWCRGGVTGSGRLSAGPPTRRRIHPAPRLPGATPVRRHARPTPHPPRHHIHPTPRPSGTTPSGTTPSDTGRHHATRHHAYPAPHPPRHRAHPDTTPTRHHAHPAPVGTTLPLPDQPRAAPSGLRPRGVGVPRRRGHPNPHFRDRTRLGVTEVHECGLTTSLKGGYSGSGCRTNSSFLIF
jgi:hypothetical protein